MQFVAVYFRWPTLIRVATDPEGNIFAIMFPDINSTSFAVQIHCLMTARGVKRPRAQIKYYKEYVKFIFETMKNCHKIIVMVAEKDRLIVDLTKRLGFQLEGTHRQEWSDGESWYDMYYFGLLRSEFSG